MSKKFVSDAVSKKLMIGGGIGFGAGIILSLVILLPLYSKVGECVSAKDACSSDFAAERIGARLVSVLMYLSLVAFVTGVVMMIVVGVKSKQQALGTPAAPAINPKTVKHLTIKILAFVTAFFIGGSIVSLIIARLVPAIYSSKDVDQLGHIFAYMIIVFYPLAGGFAVYITNKWLKKS